MICQFKKVCSRDCFISPNIISICKRVHGFYGVCNIALDYKNFKADTEFSRRRVDKAFNRIMKELERLDSIINCVDCN